MALQDSVSDACLEWSPPSDVDCSVPSLSPILSIPRPADCAETKGLGPALEPSKQPWAERVHTRVHWELGSGRNQPPRSQKHVRCRAFRTGGRAKFHGSTSAPAGVFAGESGNILQ